MSNNPRTDMICFHISSELFSIKWLRTCGPVLHLLDKVSGVTFDNPCYNKGHYDAKKKKKS